MKISAPEVMTSLEAYLIRSTFYYKHSSSEVDRSGASKSYTKDLITPYHCRRPKE